MQIHNIRVNRRLAGHAFPFDRIYLVDHEHRHLVRTLFDYSIVLPLIGPMLKAVSEIPIDRRISRTHERGNNGGVSYDAFVPSTEVPKLGTLLDFVKTSWLLLVPLLPKVDKYKEVGEPKHPAYLTAKGMREGSIIKGRKGFKRRIAKAFANFPAVEPTDVFNSQAYLHTPEKDVRPPCLLCPRMVYHQTGECSLGDFICFSHLPLGIMEAADLVNEKDSNE